MYSSKRILVLMLGVVAAAGQEVARGDTPQWLEPQFRSRIEYSLTVDEESSPFPWNYASRSAAAASRLMLDLRSGNGRYGWLYVKGAAAWSEPDPTGERVSFNVDQADYLWRSRVDSIPVPAAGARQGVEARLFAHQRRYFTGAMLAPLLQDDILDAYDEKFGLRVDAARGDSWRATALGSVLGAEWDESRKIGYARVAYLGRVFQGSAAYLNDRPGADGVPNQAVLKGEVSTLYRRFSATLSYEQSGMSESGWFMPKGHFDWGGFVGNNLSRIMPRGGAVFAEGRIDGAPFREWGTFDVVHTYYSLGEGFVGDLGTTRRGENGRSTALLFGSARVSVDGRVELTHRERGSEGEWESDGVNASLRALLNNGTELVLRGRRSKDTDDARDDFVHVSVHRSRRKVHGGMHVMLRDTGNDKWETRAAWDTQINLTTSIALYGRVVAIDENLASNAIFWRIDLRPTSHVFASIGYGRSYVGDGPYLLEDPDLEKTGETDGVYTIMVRGDF